MRARENEEQIVQLVLRARARTCPNEHTGYGCSENGEGPMCYEGEGGVEFCETEVAERVRRAAAAAARPGVRTCGFGPPHAVPVRRQDIHLRLGLLRRPPGVVPGRAS